MSGAQELTCSSSASHSLRSAEPPLRLCHQRAEGAISLTPPLTVAQLCVSTAPQACTSTILPLSHVMVPVCKVSRRCSSHAQPLLCTQPRSIRLSHGKTSEGRYCHYVLLTQEPRVPRHHYFSRTVAHRTCHQLRPVSRRIQLSRPHPPSAHYHRHSSSSMSGGR